MTDEPLVLYDTSLPGVARLTLNRPRTRNAQNLALLQTLDDCFTRAMRDEDVRVIVLGAAGQDFSSGHDLRGLLDSEDEALFGSSGSSGNFSAPDGEGYMAREEEAYIHYCRRWRSLSKPTIAQVQGRCISGGMMLAWVCDLIIASDDATFADPTPGWGSNGVEWHGYPWEFGIRKAKEFLFTGDTWTAETAHQLGMVNHVVPRSELEGFTNDMASRIATRPAFALKAAKQSVNAAQDAQGYNIAQDMAFQIHHLTHFHNLVKYKGEMVDSSKMPGMWKDKKPDDAS